MFCLGSCLYELMSLRGLPPADISQPEYSVMLQSGKRAQFHAKVLPTTLIIIDSAEVFIAYSRKSLFKFNEFFIPRKLPAIQ